MIDLILAGFNGRTFAEQGLYEMVEGCRHMAWDKYDHTANYEQKKTTVRFLHGACGYGYYNGYEQWHVIDNMKYVLKALARFETGSFDQYPAGLDSLLSDTARLWYDLWEFEGCEKLERIRMFKNGRVSSAYTLRV